MPLLVGLGEDFAPTEYPVASCPFVIGRLAKSDVCIKNSQISRRHAQIVQEDGEYVVLDLDSANGLFLNNQPVFRAKLAHGDVFNVGGVAHFIFLERPDPELTSRVIERARTSPDFTPAAYSMKKTVKMLVSEVTRIEPPAPTVEAPAEPPSVSGADELELLLQVSYALNSFLSLKEVLDTLLEKVLEITRAERGFILLRSPRTRELEVRFARDTRGPIEAAARVDFPRALANRCVAEGSCLDKATVAADPDLSTLLEQRYQTLDFLVAPLKVKKSCIGALHVDRLSGNPSASQARSGPFGRRETLLFEALCHQAAIAIDNARLAEDLKDKQRRLKAAYDELLDKNTRLQITNEKLDQKVAELAALNAVSRGLNMVSTLEQVLKLILEKTVELLAVEKGSLLLVNEEADTMELKAIVGADSRQPIARSTRLKVGEGIAGLALRQGVPISINDGHRNPQFKMLLPQDSSIRSLMCVPLVLNNRKIGVINLTNKMTGTGFTENDKTLVTTMASQAAITIENARLYNLAIFDGLTNLYVARYFHLFLDKEFQRVRRYGGPLSLVMADLDFFKTINDTHGHQVGDVVLQKVAQTIRTTVRVNDVAARYGGEEFAMILPETDLAGAVTFAERLRERIQELTIPFRERVLKVTISLGVANYPTNQVQNKTQLIALADKALLEAKRMGRNQVRLCPVGLKDGQLPRAAKPAEAGHRRQDDDAAGRGDQQPPAPGDRAGETGSALLAAAAPEPATANGTADAVEGVALAATDMAAEAASTEVDVEDAIEARDGGDAPSDGRIDDLADPDTVGLREARELRDEIEGRADRPASPGSREGHDRTDG